MDKRILKGALVKKSIKELRDVKLSSQPEIKRKDFSLIVPGVKAVYEAVKINPNLVKRIIYKSSQYKKKYIKLYELSKRRRIRQDIAGEKDLAILKRLDSEVMAERAPVVLKDARIENLVQLSEPSLVVVLDHIQDPQNLGAIVRSCACFAVSGLILPKNRTARINPTVAKVAAGAIEHISFFVAPGTVNVIEVLRKTGFTILGLDPKAAYSIASDEFAHIIGSKIALVAGQEDKGLSELVKKRCDLLVKIDQFGGVESLNVATSLSIALFETRRIELTGK